MESGRNQYDKLIGTGKTKFFFYVLVLQILVYAFELYPIVIRSLKRLLMIRKNEHCWKYIVLFESDDIQKPL